MNRPPIIADYLAEMAETSDLLMGAQELGEVLRLLVLRAKALTDADFAAIAIFDESGAVGRFSYAGMDEMLARRLGEPPRGRGLLGELRRRTTPLRLDDLQATTHFTGWPHAHPDMVGFLGVPLRAGDATIGSLYVTRLRDRPPFGEPEELSAAVLAVQAVGSLTRALDHDRTVRASLLEERARIARDLHDGTLQLLYGVTLEYTTLAAAPDVPPAIRETLQGAARRANDLIRDVRGYIALLEAKLDHHEPEFNRDVALLVRQLVPEGVDIVLNVTAAILQELSARETEDLVQIVREAVINALTHGHATRVGIDLRQSPDTNALTVQDNGAGFDADNPRDGLGLVSMRSRAESLSGKLTLVSIPNMGTTVRVVFPRREPDDPPPRSDSRLLVGDG